jgi:hypothetical protein
MGEWWHRAWHRARRRLSRCGDRAPGRRAWYEVGADGSNICGAGCWPMSHRAGCCWRRLTREFHYDPAFETTVGECASKSAMG